MDTVATFNPSVGTKSSFFVPSLHPPFYLILTNQSNFNITVDIVSDFHLYLGAKEKIAIRLDERIGYTPKTPIPWESDIATPQQTGVVGYLIVQEALPYEFERIIQMPINAS